MRACGRALPLLQPAHSLLIATMPPGQDPDDVVKSGGATALNQLLSQSRPLAEFLWQAEWTAQPLDSPEAKAGLRQRLRAHCDDIGDSDIAQHYRKFFDDRYQSAFFTTPRPAQRSFKSGRNPMKPLIGAPKNATRTALASNSDLGVFKSIVGGLLRYPDLIRTNFEALSALQIPDPSLAGLLQKILKLAVLEERLETEGLLTILEQDIQYNMAKELLRADALHFSFNRTLAEPVSDAMKERAGRELAEVIHVMAGQPEIERALQHATAQAQAHLDEESFAEQQRLLGLKRNFEQRLIELTQSDD
jgi:DNA primase